MKLAHTALIAAAAGVLTVTLAGCSAPTNGERSPAFAAKVFSRLKPPPHRSAFMRGSSLAATVPAFERRSMFAPTERIRAFIPTKVKRMTSAARLLFLRPAAGSSRADDSPSRPKTIPRLGLLIRLSMV